MTSATFSINNLSTEDSIYLENVMIDIRSYLNVLSKYSDRKVVLLFPPVNNFRRFLIHQLIDSTFRKERLSTLSVGSLYARRTVVYPSILKPMDVKCDNIPERKTSSGKKVNTIPLYRPPALRNSDIEHAHSPKERRIRKPDMQIYVPRGRRLFTSVSDENQTHIEESNKELKNIKLKQSVCDILYTPKKKKMISTSKSPEQPKSHFCQVLVSETNDFDNACVSNTKNISAAKKDEEVDSKDSIDCEDDLKQISSDDSLYKITELNNSSNCDGETIVFNDASNFCSEIRENAKTVSSSSSPDLVEKTEIFQSPEQLNKSNSDPGVEGRLTDEERTTNNDLIEIVSVESITNDKRENEPNVDIESEKKSTSEKLTSTSGANSILNVNDCEWDELFDEEGEYVDKSLINELISAIGDVSVHHASRDYKSFQTTEERTSDGGCVIEIYGFPAEFKTDDLFTVFALYRGDPGFQIVWVDDTHALAVFSSPTLADEVLNTELPFVKTRPIKNAIPKSRMKAQNFILPAVARPKTCVSLARRLVSGHLGMKINVTDQQRAAEKKILSDAREKRRLVAKQKQDAWEGAA